MKTTLINISAACLLGLALTACHSDDDTTFGVTPEASSASFTPCSGGAVMHYQLPSNLDIKSIRVRYTDAQGKQDIVEGSYLTDSLTLVGFNEARTDIPAYVSYVNNQGDVSEETATTFSTKDSGPCAFFKDAEVKSAWNGVELSYNLPEKDMKGFAHVFYIGTNPTTNEPDTILAKTINLQQGKNSSFIKFEQAMDDYDIVIRTEDFRGYFVQSKEWKGIKSYQTQKFPEDQLKVTCPSSYEDEDTKMGLKYLTDGDDRGYLAAKGKYNEYYTFAMGPFGVGKYIDIDLGQAKVLASVRIYAQCCVKESYDDIFGYSYENLLPNEVTIYGSNTGKDDDWTKIGYHNEPKDTYRTAWYSTYGLVSRGDPLSYDDLSQIPTPVYLDVTLPVSDQTYRYIRVVPNSVFLDNPHMPNRQQYVTMQELEVYTKK
jgi:hypothetical protein